MDHNFELAFNLLDEAAGRIQTQQYGITRILSHNHGNMLLTTVHECTPETGHRLVLLANDADGLMAAVEATAADLNTDPTTRILKVRAGDNMTFHNQPGTWSYQATHAGHTYVLTAGVGDEPMWTVSVDHCPAHAHDDLDEAMNTLLEHAAA